MAGDWREVHGNPLQDHDTASRSEAAASVTGGKNHNSRWGDRLGVRRRHGWHYLPLVLVLGAGLLGVAQGKTFETVIDTEEQWVYLDKFVYDDTGEGVLKYEIEIADTESNGIGTADFTYVCNQRTDVGNTTNFTVSSCSQVINPSTYLLFYNDVLDDKQDWRTVYEDRTMSCEDKVRWARQPVPIESGIINRASLPLNDAAIPRFWYVVIANCRSARINARITIWFKNSGWEEGSIMSEFSYDEQGLLEMTIFYFAMYTVGAFFIVGVMYRFMEKDLIHEIHWLLFGSFCSYWMMHLLYLITYAKYSQDGIGYDWLGIFARCLEVCGFVIFVNSLLLIARGWTITTNKLSRKSENLFLSSIIVCIYIALFFSETMLDPAHSHYVYDSWPGYLLVAMQIFLLFLFISLLHRTVSFEKRVVKRAFYKRFGTIFSIWFVQLPIFVAIASEIPSYYKTKVMFGIQWGVQLCSFLLLPTLSSTKNTHEIYSTDNNYDARIPSVARQQRVLPSALNIPASQMGSVPGGLPPVNRQMQSNLGRADGYGEGGQLGVGGVIGSGNGDHFNGGGGRIGGSGEGIIEH